MQELGYFLAIVITKRVGCDALPKLLCHICLVCHVKHNVIHAVSHVTLYCFYPCLMTLFIRILLLHVTFYNIFIYLYYNYMP